MRTEIISGDRREGLPLPPPTPPTKSAGQVKKKELERQIFTTSRELEYFTESELTTQTGYPKEQWWPGVVVKELLDNSLDACEQAGVAPVISVDFRGQSVVVSDNGPGIASEVVHKILDFSTRTSDKQAYVSPTRGAQGNALKTLLAIPYILTGGETGTIQIKSQGVRHTISVSTQDFHFDPGTATVYTRAARIPRLSALNPAHHLRRQAPKPVRPLTDVDGAG